MRDILSFILLAACILGWALFLNEKSSKPIVTGRSSDTVWLTDTIRPKQPAPKLIKGDTDTLTVVDTVAVDSLIRIIGDTVKTWMHIARGFQLQYEDSIQKLKVDIDPVRKTGLFKPFYKPLPHLSKEITNTAYINNDRWFQLLIGAGYQSRDSSQVYFFLDGRISVGSDITLKPRISTDGIGGEFEYQIF